MIVYGETERELAVLRLRELDRLADRPRIDRELGTPPRLAALSARARAAGFRLLGIPAPPRHAGSC